MTDKKILNLIDTLLPRFSKKRVLDIGSIGHHYRERREIGTFYFERFQEHAEYAKGIDILEESVNDAASDGFNIHVGNAENFVDEGAYDFIFAGELIEHLSNAGNFLECCIKNLNDEGVLIVTTPNTFAFSRLFRVAMRLTNEPPLNNEHTCYYTPQALKQLTVRYGFSVESCYYTNYDYGKIQHKFFKKLFLKFDNFLSSLFPQFSQSFVCEMKKTNA